MYPIALCRHTRSSTIPSFSVVKANIQCFPISLIQKWLKKRSVGSLLYSLNFSVQGLYFFPPKKELSALHFRSYLQHSWSESASNNFLHISSFDFYWLTSFPLPLIFFFYLILLLIYLWMFYLIKCWKQKNCWWLYRNLERDQLLADLLLVCMSRTHFLVDISLIFSSFGKWRRTR